MVAAGTVEEEPVAVQTEAAPSVEQHTVAEEQMFDVGPGEEVELVDWLVCWSFPQHWLSVSCGASQCKS